MNRLTLFLLMLLFTPGIGNAQDHSKFRLSIDLGAEYRLRGFNGEAYIYSNASLPIAKLGIGFSSGLAYFFSEEHGSGLAYYFDEEYGVGLFYSISVAKGEDDNRNYIVLPSDEKLWGTIKSLIVMNYLAPGFVVRKSNIARTKEYVYALGAGMLIYQDFPRINGVEYMATSISPGVNASISWDTNTNENWTAGFKLSVMAGLSSGFDFYSNFDHSNISVENESSDFICHVNFGFGLRFNK